MCLLNKKGAFNFILSSSPLTFKKLNDHSFMSSPFKQKYTKTGNKKLNFTLKLLLASVNDDMKKGLKGRNNTVHLFTASNRTLTQQQT